VSLTVAGVDLSMTSTGITRLCWDDIGTVQAIQRRITSAGKDSDTLARTYARLRRIATQVAVEVAYADLIVMEGISHGSIGGKSHDRTGLWWLTLDAIADGHARDVAEFFAVVTPAQRQMYAVGKGGGVTAAKDRVLAAVLRRYPPHWGVDGNDLADSTLLAAMGARHLDRPVEESLPLTHLAAMTKVRWPALAGVLL
jgi:crossover junction endodeoxyribonuclease RuvC